jgi:hypothetical protein
MRYIELTDDEVSQLLHPDEEEDAELDEAWHNFLSDLVSDFHNN